MIKGVLTANTMLAISMNDQERIAHIASRKKTIDELAQLLSKILIGVLDITDDGRILYGRRRVATIGSLKIDIRSDEHAPPHFHVIGPDIDAAFSINDCSLLKGNIGDRDFRIVKFWFRASKDRLVQIWNETRPSDCPVALLKTNKT